jgi:hypothetical protein
MQQRQPRLGDILDDYCPRERRLTNHAVVAMVGADVKQTRCTTCDAEHEYKHAKVPRQRRKADTPPALYAAPAAAPKRVVPDAPPANGMPEPARPDDDAERGEELPADGPMRAEDEGDAEGGARHVEADGAEQDAPADEPAEEGPVHRPLIRATLPRPEGQPPPVRPAPDFTIRQPGGRPNRFRRPHARGGQPFQGGRNGNVGGHVRGGFPRPSGRPQGAMGARPPKRHGPGGKRSK